jgi:hypothetical protein
MKKYTVNFMQANGAQKNPAQEDLDGIFCADASANVSGNRDQRGRSTATLLPA